MSGSKRQIRDDFVEASQEMAAGHSIESVLEARTENASDIEPMLHVVEALRGLAPPAASPGALARIEERAKAAARQRQPELRAHVMSQGRTGAQVRPLVLLSKSGREPGVNGTAPTGGDRSGLKRLAGILGTKGMVAVASVAIFLVVVFIVAGLVGRTTGRSAQQLESYSGIITQMEPGKWRVDDDTEVFVDSLTEIHGLPMVGANMTCIAERLPGNERYRALEVWVLPDEEGP